MFAGIRRREPGLGHPEARADLAVEQRFEPLLLLLGCAHALEHLHVAGVGRGAVEALGGERVLAELLGDVGVVEVRQPLSGLRVGQEEVPQPVRLRLRLHAVEQLELAGREAPPIGAALAEREVLGGDRLDLVGDERLDLVEKRAGGVGHREVEQLASEVVDVQRVGRHGPVPSKETGAQQRPHGPAEGSFSSSPAQTVPKRHQMSAEARAMWALPSGLFRHLPRGRALPEEVWWRRHRGILDPAVAARACGLHDRGHRRASASPTRASRRA